MVRLVDETYYAKSDHMKSFFRQKETDCILFSEEGIEFNIHKEILCQTDFLRNILSSSEENSLNMLTVFCPCSKMDLERMINFLYRGSISYKSDMDLFKILDNLNQIFGFPKERFLPNNYADLEKEFNITKVEKKDSLDNKTFFKEDKLDCVFDDPSIQSSDILESYESQNETLKSQNETPMYLNENYGSQNESYESQNETHESQNETYESQNETYEPQNGTYESPNEMLEFPNKIVDTQTHLKTIEPIQNGSKSVLSHENEIDFTEISKVKYEEKELITNSHLTNICKETKVDNSIHIKSKNSEIACKEKTKDTRLQSSVNDIENPLNLYLCDTDFTQKVSLKKHVSKAHEKVKPFKCDLCETTFTKQLSLKRHVSTIHEKNKLQTCDICNKSFTEKRSLKTHVEIVHEKKKPFMCKICNHSLSTKSNLKTHVKSVHLSYRPFKCNICDYSSYNRHHMTVHVASVHERKKSFICEFCVYSCFAKSDMNKHLTLVHDGKRPFKCSYCNATFKSKRDLNRHRAGVHEAKNWFLS